MCQVSQRDHLIENLLLCGCHVISFLLIPQRARTSDGRRTSASSDDLLRFCGSGVSAYVLWWADPWNRRTTCCLTGGVRSLSYRSGTTGRRPLASRRIKSDLVVLLRFTSPT